MNAIEKIHASKSQIKSKKLRRKLAHAEFSLLSTVKVQNEFNGTNN